MLDYKAFFFFIFWPGSTECLPLRAVDLQQEPRDVLMQDC